MRSHNALFAGLITVDIIHRVKSFPQANHKIQADEQEISAGGPATNAAVTYAALSRIAAQQGVLLGQDTAALDIGAPELQCAMGVSRQVADKNNSPDVITPNSQGSTTSATQCGQVQLYSAVGRGILAEAARNDITIQGIEVIDCIPQRIDAIPTSLVMVESATGLRSVSGRNSVGHLDVQSIEQRKQELEEAAVILVDGHYPEIAFQALTSSTAAVSPSAIKILDGGSWKPWLPTLLPFIDCAILSADFMPPIANTTDDLIDFLHGYGINHIIHTQGHAPVRYWWNKEAGEVDIAPVDTVCTLGAGDVFHGAFAWWVSHNGFPESAYLCEKAIEWSSRIAGLSLQSFGTRRWLSDKSDELKELVTQASRGADGHCA
ncbi:MAG: PfkB family carbohydrate kinase [Actinomycetaceae bacterium]|nr:PfkB family carbohydrate kinase [Actinomycetaceae bacterium]